MRRFGMLFRCVVLSIGFSMIDPEKIEELMCEAQRPRIAHVIPMDNGDDLIAKLLGGRS